MQTSKSNADIVNLIIFTFGLQIIITLAISLTSGFLIIPFEFVTSSLQKEIALVSIVVLSNATSVIISSRKLSNKQKPLLITGAGLIFSMYYLIQKDWLNSPLVDWRVIAAVVTIAISLTASLIIKIFPWKSTIINPISPN